MSDFDWKVWLTKLGKKALFGAAVGALSEIIAFLGAEPVPTEYVWITVIAIEALEIALNAIKHKFLVE